MVPPAWPPGRANRAGCRAIGRASCWLSGVDSGHADPGGADGRQQRMVPSRGVGRGCQEPSPAPPRVSPRARSTHCASNHHSLTDGRPRVQQWRPRRAVRGGRCSHGGRLLRRRLDTWTSTLEWGGPTPSLIAVADDVLGGVFALDGGAFAGTRGEAFYLAPDTLEWESCEMGYSDLVQWALTGDLEQFYDGFRWTGWQEDVRRFGPDQSLSIHPP